MQISEMMQIEPLNDSMATTKAELKDQKDLSGIIKREYKIKPDDINFLSILFGSAKDTNLKINLIDNDRAEDKESQNNAEIKTDDAKQENLNTDAMLNELAVSCGEICQNGLIGETEVTMDTGELGINQEGLLKTWFDIQPPENVENDSAEITDNVNDKELNLNDDVIKSKDINENPVMVSDELDKLKKNIEKTGFDLQQPEKVSDSGDKVADNAINSEPNPISDRLNADNAINSEPNPISDRLNADNAINSEPNPISDRLNMENNKEKPDRMPSEFNRANRSVSEPDVNILHDKTIIRNIFDDNSFSKELKLNKKRSSKNAVIPDSKNSIAQKPDKQAGLNRENIFYISSQKYSEAEKVSENLQKGTQAINIPESKHIKNNVKGGEHNIVKNELSLLNTKEPRSISDPVMNTKGVNSGPKLSHTKIVNQIVNKMVFSLKNGRSKVKMSLKPKSLGHLRLEISSNNHKVDIKIMTQSTIVRDMIEHHINDLRAGLGGHGLEMDKVDVFVSNDSNQYRGKDERYNGFSHVNHDYEEIIAADKRPNESLLEPVWANRMDSEENRIDYFA